MQKIVKLELDHRTITYRNPDVEQERRVAIFDLLENNHFNPVKDYPTGYAGPFHLVMKVEDGRLVFAIHTTEDELLEQLILGLGPFRRLIREYFAVCESYFQAIRSSTPEQIEAIDMGRRGLHNEGSELLRERLKNKVDVDFETARRLFTLICVLHIR
ncbi:MAG: UPF0262 family protein [Pseudomonadota bacterium]